MKWFLFGWIILMFIGMLLLILKTNHIINIIKTSAEITSEIDKHTEILAKVVK